MSRLLIAPAVFMVLSACATQHAACPQDTTADFDVSVAQTNHPVAARPMTTASRFAVPKPIAYTNVRYTITIVNRTNEPLHIGEITLDEPRVNGRAPDECFGVKRLGASLAATSRGFDKIIDARGSASFEMTATEMFDARDVFEEPAQVVTLQIHTDSSRGKRSEQLTRKVKLAKMEEAKGL